MEVFALLLFVSVTAAGGCCGGKAAVGRELEIICLTVSKPPTKESGKIVVGSVEEVGASDTFSTVVAAVVAVVVPDFAVVAAAIFSLFLFSFVSSPVVLSSIGGVVDGGWSRSTVCRVFTVVDTCCGGVGGGLAIEPSSLLCNVLPVVVVVVGVEATSSVIVVLVVVSVSVVVSVVVPVVAPVVARGAGTDGTPVVD